MSLDTLIQLIETYRYWILFPLACFEGPITGFIVGTLVALGYFNPIIAYTLLLFGDIIPDWVYYLLGRYGAKKAFVTNILKKAKLDGHLDVIRTLWHTHGGKTMFFSKLAYGLSTPFLILAGLVGLSPRKFLLYALPVTIAQYAILMGLGYFFGIKYYSLITSSFEGVAVLIAVFVVVAGLYIALTYYMRSRLLAEEKKEEEELRK